MKIIHNDNPFFNICLENVFSTKELEIIFKEINELKKDFKDPEFYSICKYTPRGFKKKRWYVFG